MENFQYVPVIEKFIYSLDKEKNLNLTVGF